MQIVFDKLAELLGDQKLGLVLHVGAGLCLELETYCQQNAEQIVLVEANPELAGILLNKLHKTPQASVINVAVSSIDGNSDLYVLNNPRESSLLEPVQLIEQNRNLNVSRKVGVNVTTLPKLLENTSIDSGKMNFLILEVQGSELDILSSTPVELLHQFNWIAVRTSKEPLYKGGADLNSVNAVIKNIGFEQSYSDSAALTSLFNEVLYQRDNRHIEIVRLKNQLKEAQLTIHNLAEEYSHNLEQLTREREAQQFELEEQRRQTLHWKDQFDACQQHDEQCARERDEQIARNAELEMRLAEVESRLGEQLNVVETWKVQTDQLNQQMEAQKLELVEQRRQTLHWKDQFDTCQQQIAQATRKQEDHLREIDGYKELIDQLRQDIAEARQTVSVSIKMQSLREADLKDLQGRYQESVLKQQGQQQLLLKLTERLGVVANYFHQLPHVENIELQALEEKPKSRRITRSTRGTKFKG